MIAIHAHDIPHIFPPTVLPRPRRRSPPRSQGREDWRNVPLVTIDPADAKDHDDAVYAEPDPDPKNPGGYIVTVAIADVAAYVRPGSALDREALKRGNSVYFPDRVVPMLPERISNDLCSLGRRGPRRRWPCAWCSPPTAASCATRFHRVHDALGGQAAPTPQAQAAIDGKPDDKTGPLLDRS